MIKIVVLFLLIATGLAVLTPQEIGRARAECTRTCGVQALECQRNCWMKFFEEHKRGNVVRHPNYAARIPASRRAQPALQVVSHGVVQHAAAPAPKRRFVSPRRRFHKK